jgi:hypothetical protein
MQTIVTIAKLGKFTPPAEAEKILIPFSDRISTTRIIVTRDEGTLFIVCRCGKHVKALYPHPLGRGYICSSCVGNIKTAFKGDPVEKHD